MEKFIEKGPIYIICKLVTWIAPAILVAYCSQEYMYTNMTYVVIAYAIHFVMKIRAHFSGRSRMSHEIWVFIGMIIMLYTSFTMESEIVYSDTFVKNYMPFKIITIILSVLIIASKVYTLYAQTDDYNSKADEREATRIRSIEIGLDSDIESATRWVEKAKPGEELRQAEMELERAKLRRDQYYRNKQ